MTMKTILELEGEITQVEAHADDEADACWMTLCLGPDMQEVEIPLANVEAARIAGAHLYRRTRVTFSVDESEAVQPEQQKETAGA